MVEYYIEKLNLSRNYADRYKNCKILTDVETGDTLLSTRESIEIAPHRTDRYHRIEHHEMNRLDIIAYHYYNNPMLWWVIAEANNIFDPFSEILPGTLLRIPNVDSLYGNNGVLL